MKRGLVLLLCITLLIALVGCGGKSGEQPSSEEASAANDASEPAQSGESTPTESDESARGDGKDSSGYNEIYGVSRFNRYAPPSTSDEIKAYASDKASQAMWLQRSNYPQIYVGDYSLEKISQYFERSMYSSIHNTDRIYEQNIIDYDNNKIVISSESLNFDLCEFDSNGNITMSRAGYSYKYNDDGLLTEVGVGEDVQELQIEYDDRGRIVRYVPGWTFEERLFSGGGKKYKERILEQFYEPSEIVYNDEDHIIQWMGFNIEYEDGVMTRMTDGEYAVAFEWDDHGNLISLVSENNELDVHFQYLYDDKGNILFEKEVEREDGLGSSYYSYDSQGNRVVCLESESSYFDKFIYTWKSNKTGEILPDPPELNHVYGEYYDVENFVYFDFKESFAGISLVDMYYAYGEILAKNLYCDFSDAINATFAGYLVDGTKIEGTIKQGNTSTGEKVAIVSITKEHLPEGRELFWEGKTYECIHR